MWPSDFNIDVSRESLEKLEIYHRLLFKWQKAINLVSPKTMQESWVRHFADSAQLSAYIGDDVTRVMDWGSGAGFPGAVLAIMRPEIAFTLVESDERKCQFIRTVSRETSVPIRIENRRIEAFVSDVPDAPNLIMARALASVGALIGYAAPLIERDSTLRMLLLKGENVAQELDKARQNYVFDVDQSPSLTNPLASIVALSAIGKVS